MSIYWSFATSTRVRARKSQFNWEKIPKRFGFKSQFNWEMYPIITGNQAIKNPYQMARANFQTYKKKESNPKRISKKRPADT